MSGKTKKVFYIFYGICLLVIIAENILFWEKGILKYNLVAAWTIILLFIADGGGFSIEKGSLIFYIFLGIVFLLYIFIMYLIGNSL